MDSCLLTTILLDSHVVMKVHAVKGCLFLRFDLLGDVPVAVVKWSDCQLVSRFSLQFSVWHPLGNPFRLLLFHLG